MRKRILAVILTVAMLATMLAMPAMAAAKSFTDVNEGDWFKMYVDWNSDKGYFVGMSETTFEPETTMDRAMFVTVLGRVAVDIGIAQPGDIDKSAVTPFTDVEKDRYYTGYVAWANSLPDDQKIVKGKSETEFAPYDPVTREEMTAFMKRFVDYAVWWAEQNNYECTTPLVAKAPVTFTDMDDASNYAKETIEYCRTLGRVQTDRNPDYGVVDGYLQDDGTHKFDPKRNSARSEVAAVIYRLRMALTPIYPEEPKDLLYDAMGAAVNTTNGLVPAWADYFGGSANVTLGEKLPEPEVITVTADVEGKLDSDFMDDAVAAGILYAYSLAEHEAFDVSNLDEIKSNIEAVADDLGVTLKETDKNALAQAALAYAKDGGKQVWANFRDDSEDPVYLFESVTINGNDGELYTIDTNKGEGPTTVSIGTNPGIKATAEEIARQLEESLKENTTETATPQMTAKLGISFNNLAERTKDSNPNYELVINVKLDGNYEYNGTKAAVTYQYDGGAHNIYFYIPVAKLNEVTKNAIGEAVTTATVEKIMGDEVEQYKKDHPGVFEKLRANMEADDVKSIVDEYNADHPETPFDVIQEAKDRGISIPDSADLDAVRQYIYEIAADYIRNHPDLFEEDSIGGAAGEATDSSALIEAVRNLSVTEVLDTAISVDKKLGDRGATAMKYVSKAISLIPNSVTVTFEGDDTYTPADLAGIKGAENGVEAVSAFAELIRGRTLGNTTIDEFTKGVKVAASFRDYSREAIVYLKDYANYNG